MSNMFTTEIISSFQHLNILSTEGELLLTSLGISTMKLNDITLIVLYWSHEGFQGIYFPFPSSTVTSFQMKGAYYTFLQSFTESNRITPKILENKCCITHFYRISKVFFFKLKELYIFGIRLQNTNTHRKASFCEQLVLFHFHINKPWGLRILIMGDIWTWK